MANPKKYYYVYQITNNINGKKYIGKRGCNCEISDDDYYGSGTLIRAAISKYGKENFTKEVLKTFQDESSAYEYEAKYIESVKADKNNAYYNICPGGYGGVFSRSHNLKDEIIINHRDYLVQIQSGILKSDIHAAQKLSYYIEYLFSNDVNVKNTIIEIRNVAKDYYDGWRDDEIKNDIKKMYEQCYKKDIEAINFAHTDRKINIYKSEINTINSIDGKHKKKFLLALLIWFKFHSPYYDDGVKFKKAIHFNRSEISSFFNLGYYRKQEQVEIFDELVNDGLIKVYDDDICGLTFAICESIKHRPALSFPMTNKITPILDYIIQKRKMKLCRECGTPIYTSSNGKNIKCVLCATYHKQNPTIAKCQECGDYFVIHNYSKRSFRCHTCQSDINKQKRRTWSRAYYHNSISTQNRNARR